MTRRALRVARGEREILRMLWESGPLTIGQAYRAFPRFGKPVSYPTMQTRLNRMAEKGLLSRSDARPARYRAAAGRDQVRRGHLRELIGEIGGGEVVPLVADLLSGQKLTAQQVAELRQLLEEVSPPAESTSKRRK